MIANLSFWTQTIKNYECEALCTLKELMHVNLICEFLEFGLNSAKDKFSVILPANFYIFIESVLTD